MTLAFLPTLTNPPLQEILYRETDDPWRIAVACMLLNRTSRIQVDRVWPALFDGWPTARELSRASETALSDLLAPLGLASRRGHLLRLMSYEWDEEPGYWQANCVTRYAGLGGYAQDAHLIFARGRLDLQPEDRVLAQWVGLLRAVPIGRRPERYRPAREASSASA